MTSKLIHLTMTFEDEDGGVTIKDLEGEAAQEFWSEHLFGSAAIQDLGGDGIPHPWTKQHGGEVLVIGRMDAALVVREDGKIEPSGCHDVGDQGAANSASKAVSVAMTALTDAEASRVAMRRTSERLERLRTSTKETH